MASTSQAVTWTFDNVNGTTGNTVSGAGPATAIHGTAASFSGSVVTLDGSPDLSGFTTGWGLFLLTSTGRQFFDLSSADNNAKTVTCVTAPLGTATGRTWAIGGKLKNLDDTNSKQLLGTDFKDNWTMDILQTGTNYVLTAALAIKVPTSTVTASTPATVKSSSATRPLITTATNSINLFNLTSSDPIQFRHLAFSNTAGTKGTAGSTGNAITPVSGGLNGLSVDDCTFDGFVSAIMVDNVTNFGTNRIVLTQCEIKNCTDKAISAQFSTGNSVFHMDHCNIHDNTGVGVSLQNAGGGFFEANFCTFENNSKGTTTVSNSTFANAVFTYTNCTFRGNTGPGIDLPGSQFVLIAHDNIFDSNGDYGIKMSATEAAFDSGTIQPILFKNAFRNNTNGTILNGPPTWNDVAPSVSPFNSSTDSGLNATATGGPVCKAAASVAPNATANTAGDIGAIPSGGGATAGGVSKLAGAGGGLAA